MTRSEVHVVILAAGVGSRLSGTGTCPKWLTPVGSRSIADLQLAAVDALPFPVRLDVVTGHRADLVQARIAGRPGTAAVHNTHYAALNNWWSVLIALRHRREAGRVGPLVVVNSDLWAPSRWTVRAIEAALLASAPAMVVDLERTLTDEAMKVAAVAGRATDIGKVGVTAPIGEYTGVLVVPAVDVPVLEKALESFVGDPDRDSAWYEHAVRVTMDLGLDWQLVPAPDSGWVEIDDDADLATAMRLAGAA